MLWGLAAASYVTASYETSDQPPQGNLALFAVLFLVCCVEVVIVKVVSDDMESAAVQEMQLQRSRQERPNPAN